MIDIDNLKFDEKGLIPAVVIDAVSKKVLTVAYMNKESLEISIKEGKTCFWSRSRQELWRKGETSGNYLHLVSIQSDCDNDTLLIKVNPDGAVCHKGTDTCWGDTNECNPVEFLSELQDFINKRREEMPENSYTTSLFRKGINKIAQKVGEEAVETVIEAVGGTEEQLVYEGADLLYHLIVLLSAKGLRIETLANELAKRHNPNWDKARHIKKSHE